MNTCLENMESNLNNLDQQIYILVINTISFLKTLQKKGVRNDITSLLSNRTNTFNKKFNYFYDKSENSEVIKQNLIPLITEIINILINNFEEFDKSIINEKADLYIMAERIKKDIENL